MSEHTHRDTALDNLRATAMLLGLVTHGVLPFKATRIGGYPIHDRHSHVLADACYFALHDFRMQVFFVLAGFAAAALAARGVGALARNRLRRVVLPLLLAVAVLAPVMHVLLAYHLAAAGDPNPVTRDDLVAAFDAGVALGPNFHLWFLYYLTLCSATLAVLLAGRRVVPAGVTRTADAGFRRLLGWRWRAAVLAAAGVPLLWGMADWWVETPQGWVPDGAVYAYYLGFFAFGAGLHRHRDLLPGFGRRWAACLVVANVVVLPAMLRLTVSGNWAEDERWVSPAQLAGWKAAAIFLSGLYTWLMVEGLVGLFRRHCAGAGAGWRYLGRASYWCYLAGFPIQVALQVSLADHPMPAVVKFLLVTALTLGILLASYELVVRRSWVGRLLNGRERPPAEAARSIAYVRIRVECESVTRPDGREIRPQAVPETVGHD